jgi:hypothetical protein
MMSTSAPPSNHALYPSPFHSPSAESWVFSGETPVTRRSRWSLYGPVFRLQRDLLVTGVSPENTHDSADGEWKGLMSTSAQTCSSCELGHTRVRKKSSFKYRAVLAVKFASPLYGPVFRLQRDLLVTGVSPENTHDSADGEWKGCSSCELGHTRVRKKSSFKYRAVLAVKSRLAS